MAARLSSSVSRIYAAITLQRARQKLERYFRDRGMIRRITVVPGMLDLECIGPIEPRTVTITGTSATGEVTEFKSTSTTSTWSGMATFPFWGQPTDLTILANGECPSDLQLAAAESLFRFPDCMRNEIQQRVYDYYTAEILPHDPKDESGKPFPFIHSADELDSVVYLPPTIQLDQSRDAVLTFALQFAARWNYYSIEVRLKDWKITFVG